MSSEVAKRTTHQLDAFDGFNEAIEGSDNQSQSSVSVLGLKLKYLDPQWTNPDEQEVKELLVVHDVQRKVQKWLDDTRPADTIIVAPGQPWPNIAEMNKECPETEWRDKFGKRQGPWQGEHVVCFFNPDTMVRYWWPSPISTVGSAICVRELVAQTRLMRSFKGEYVYPLVDLSHTHMPTGYGGRERPNLVVKNWVTFGGGGAPVLPAPNTPPLTSGTTTTPSASSPPAAADNPLGMQSVPPLTAKEVTQDEILF
jgi:hypothetical protein